MNSSLFVLSEASALSCQLMGLVADTRQESSSVNLPSPPSASATPASIYSGIDLNNTIDIAA